MDTPRKVSTLEDNKGGSATRAVPIRTTGPAVRTSTAASQQPRLSHSESLKDEYSFNCNELCTFDNIETELTTDYFEYEQGQADIIVKGRLRDKIQFWIDIDAPRFVVDTIRDGYILPFYSNPSSVCLSNNLSALNNADFVGTAIHDLLARGLIEETPHIPFVVNPLTVSTQSNGKKRLILDLREINKHLWKQSVKFDDMRIAKLFINNNSHLFKYDVHSAYHHIDIFYPHTKYLGFSWVFDGITRYFKFLV